MGVRFFLVITENQLHSTKPLLMLRNKIIEIFVSVDDFCTEFEPEIAKHVIQGPQGAVLASGQQHFPTAS